MEEVEHVDNQETDIEVTWPATAPTRVTTTKTVRIQEEVKFVVYVKKTDEMNIKRIYYNPYYCDVMLENFYSLYYMYAVPR